MKKYRYVLGFLFDDERKRVVLILKSHPEWQKGRFNGLGGTIEDGEKPIAAMSRESMEESGVAATWEKYMVDSGDDWSLHIYRAFKTDALENITATTEEIPVVFFLDNLPVGMVQKAQWYIFRALNNSNRPYGGGR